jgi:hypothetical protein
MICLLPDLIHVPDARSYRQWHQQPTVIEEFMESPPCLEFAQYGVTYEPQTALPSAGRFSTDIGSSSREQTWLVANQGQYAGQWVALVGERLIAASHDARAVFTKARDSGIKSPLIVRVSDSELPWGGW